MVPVNQTNARVGLSWYSSNNSQADPKHLPSLPRLGLSLVFHHSQRPWLPSKETLEMEIAVNKIKSDQ